MTQYQTTIPNEDKRFLINYCQEKAKLSFIMEDLKSALFWSNLYIEFIEEWRNT